VIRDAMSQADLKVCLEMYKDINDESFIHVDDAFALKRIREFTKLSCTQGGFYLSVEGHTIVGWMAYHVTSSQYGGERQVVQHVCGVAPKGLHGIRVQLELHEELIRRAYLVNAASVVSSGNPYDTSFVFARVLERQGWKRRGFMAIYELQ
jgi:hypothetical protein